MTARGVGIVTVRFREPSTEIAALLDDGLELLRDNASFRYPIRSHLKTLSPKDVPGESDPVGMLYVPDLQTDACKETEAGYLLRNTTRLHNLPADVRWSVVAIAPWFSATCMLEYLQSARNASTVALLVYQPGSGSGTPPPMNRKSWRLNDGDSWKKENTFPTYALPSTSAGLVVDEMAMYSGNATDIPYYQELASELKPTDYVRLCATVSTETETETGTGQLPSLWVFMVVVLAILACVLMCTSFGMHVIQNRRREDLRRRVVNGEVNLEEVGVKRLTVPRTYLVKLPLYVYAGPPGEQLEKVSPQPPAQAHSSAPTTAVSASRPPSRAPFSHSQCAERVTAFSQPTCPICLDDFEPHQTQVRELRCRHVFHPDCIDTFLLQCSSLCPMCKSSVLPKGYCPPKITNLMVYRFRVISRRQGHAATNNSNTPVPVAPNPTTTEPPGLSIRLADAITNRRTAPGPVASRPTDIEMAAPDATPPLATPPTLASSGSDGAVITPETGATADVIPECAEARPSNRREWARQRAMALLGNRHVPANDEETDVPLWRQRIRTVFPGFR